MFSLGLTHHYETENLMKAIYFFNMIVANHQPMNPLLHQFMNFTHPRRAKKQCFKTEMKSLLLKNTPIASMLNY